MALFHHTVGRRELEQLAQRGGQATAMVRAASDTGKRKDAEWLFELNLAVSPLNRPGFDASFEQWLPAGLVPQGGATVTVWVLDRKVAVDPSSIAMPEPPMPQAPGWGGRPGFPGSGFGSSRTTTTVLLNGVPVDAASLDPTLQQAVEQGLDQASQSLRSVLGDQTRTAGNPIGMNLDQLGQLQSRLGGAPSHGVRSQAEATQLMASGRPATARVLSVTDDAQIGAMTRATLILQVEPPGEPAFVETLVVTFGTAQKRAAVTPGGEVPVRFDPNDRTKVVLDGPAMGF